MKTSEEIKKGLECCVPKWAANHWKTCDSKCPYVGMRESCRGQLTYDALAYIEQLERERDAALADLKGLGCTYCKRLESPDESMCFDKCVDNCNWEWRGAKEEKDENA